MRCGILFRRALLHRTASTCHTGTAFRTVTTSSPTLVSEVHSSPASRIVDDNILGTRDEAGTQLRQYCRMLHAIVADTADQDAYIRRRRVAGVLRRLEPCCIAWMRTTSEKVTAHDTRTVCHSLLHAMTCVAPFLARREGHAREQATGRQTGRLRHSPFDAVADEDWSGSSSLLSSELSDVLCVCLQLTAQADVSAAERVWLLEAAVQLELPEVVTLQQLCHSLTTQAHCESCTVEELVQLLRLISLAVKRCHMPRPSLEHLLCRLPPPASSPRARPLTPREVLITLSSLVRLRQGKGYVIEATANLTRRAAVHPGQYKIRDVIYALQAIALLPTCHVAYAAAVLERCAELLPQMTVHELGDVSKYVALLSPTRSTNTLGRSCGRELARVLPAVARRAEQLLGKFALRDAKCVLRCLTQHRVRHTAVFSRLMAEFANDQ